MEGLDSPTVFRLGQPTLGQPLMSLDYRATGTPAAESAYPDPAAPPDGRLLRIESRLAALEDSDLTVLRALVVALDQRLYTLEHPTRWYIRARRWFRALWWSISGHHGDPPA
jgi:hypothetical protein